MNKNVGAERHLVLADTAADPLEIQAGNEVDNVLQGPESLTSESPDDVLGTHPGCLVLFSAPWCGVDRHVRAEVANLTGSHDEILIVDCNDHPHLADRYRIDVFPTFLLLEKGSERGRKVGAVSRSEIQDLLKELRS